jgi:hypothetical protein
MATAEISTSVVQTKRYHPRMMFNLCYWPDIHIGLLSRCVSDPSGDEVKPYREPLNLASLRRKGRNIGGELDTWLNCYILVSI